MTPLGLTSLRCFLSLLGAGMVVEASIAGDLADHLAPTYGEEVTSAARAQSPDDRKLALADYGKAHGGSPGGKLAPPPPPLLGEAEAVARGHRQAELALRVGDFAAAAEIYARIAGEATDPKRRRDALLELSETYRKMDDPLRVIAVLERFKKEFPDDREAPEILLRLGFLYRETGAPQQAVDAFFSVLKQSFRMSGKEVEHYRQITDEASLQIAETYYRIQQYDLAADFFTRLVRSLPASSPSRFELQIKNGYACYFAGDFRRVIHLLNPKEWTAGQDHRQAEGRFLRAAAFWALRDAEAARAEVLSLSSLEVEPNRDPYWNYWWKFVGNELANDLFARRDFAMAHKLYYSLLHLSDEPTWQLPIIFQIGRCREEIGFPNEAKTIYERILTQLAANGESSLAGNLVVLESRVKDQLSEMAWHQELSDARQAFAPPPSDSPHDSFQEDLATLGTRDG